MHSNSAAEVIRTHYTMYHPYVLLPHSKKQQIPSWSQLTSSINIKEGTEQKLLMAYQENQMLQQQFDNNLHWRGWQDGQAAAAAAAAAATARGGNGGGNFGGNLAQSSLGHENFGERMDVDGLTRHDRFSHRTCYGCGQTGHIVRDCPQGGGHVAAAGGENLTCFGCGQFGHIARDCTHQGDGGGLAMDSRLLEQELLLSALESA